MNQRFAMAFAFCSLASGASAENARRPPNIVLVVADDLGYGELGCFGQEWIRTPRIDRLASEGLRCTEYYAGAPVCAPSRCVLMTGKHLGHAAIRDNGPPPKDAEYERMKAAMGWEFPGQTPLPDSEITMGELLRARGYATAAIGKWGLGHFGTSGDPNRQGFDLFFGFNCQVHAHNHFPIFLWRNGAKVLQPGNTREATGETYSQDEFTDEALRFVRENRDRPFFLYLPLAIPHLSIQVPDETLAEYENAIPEQDYEHRGYLPHPKPRAGYAAMITHMDRDIGRIVDLIDGLGLGDNTLIVFTSDNGPTYDRLGGSDSDFFNSAAGMRGLKGSVYEGGIKAPLVARWPGRVAAGSQTDLTSGAWDLLPTFCEAAGAEAPEGIDGVSLLPTWTGQGVQAPVGPLVWDFPGYSGQQAVRFGEWKAVRRGLAKKNGGKLELYNLSVDPGERNDVAAENPDVAERAMQLLATNITAAGGADSRP